LELLNYEVFEDRLLVLLLFVEGWGVDELAKIIDPHKRN